MCQLIGTVFQESDMAYRPLVWQNELWVYMHVHIGFLYWIVDILRVLIIPFPFYYWMIHHFVLLFFCEFYGPRSFGERNKSYFLAIWLLTENMHKSILDFEYLDFHNIHWFSSCADTCIQQSAYLHKFPELKLIIRTTAIVILQTLKRATTPHAHFTVHTKCCMIHTKRCTVYTKQFLHRSHILFMCTCTSILQDLQFEILIKIIYS